MLPLQSDRPRRRSPGLHAECATRQGGSAALPAPSHRHHRAEAARLTTTSTPPTGRRFAGSRGERSWTGRTSTGTTARSRIVGRSSNATTQCWPMLGFGRFDSASRSCTAFARRIDGASAAHSEIDPKHGTYALLPMFLLGGGGPPRDVSESSASLRHSRLAAFAGSRGLHSRTGGFVPDIGPRSNASSSEGSTTSPTSAPRRSSTSTSPSASSRT